MDSTVNYRTTIFAKLTRGDCNQPNYYCDSFCKIGTLYSPANLKNEIWGQVVYFIYPLHRKDDMSEQNEIQWKNCQFILSKV